MSDLDKRFSNWVDHGLILYKYISRGLSVKLVDKMGTLDQSIVHYLNNLMHKEEPFQSSKQSINLYDHPYVLRSLKSNSDINTINPYINSIVNSVHGIDEPIDSLMFVQTHVNTYLDDHFNAGRNVADHIEFFFINQTFYGSGPGSIMGLFVNKGLFEHNALKIKHSLNDMSTSEWFVTNNDVELADKETLS